MDKNAFELQYKDVAARVGTELGVPPGALIAQWGLETGWGKSVIPGTNNLGNIKDFSGKGVTATDNLTGSKDKYRAYATVDEFATDFTSLIKRKYPAAMNQPTAAGFATALKAGGYAEDKDYVAKLTGLAGEQVPAAPASPTRTWSALKGEDKGLQGRLAEASGVYRAQEEAEPSALEMLGAAMAGNTDAKLFRPIADALFGEEFAPVAGFKPDLAALPQNWDPELKEDYLGATSQQAADKVLNTFNDGQMRLRAIGSQGTATAIGVSLLAEGLSVTNWATAWAAPAVLAARGVGSAALAARGASRAAVIGSSIAENVLSGTAIEATVQLLDGRFKGTDLAISLVADSLIGAAAGALTKSAAQGAQFATVERMMQRLADSAIEQEGAAVARAQAKLGNMATPEQVVAEVQAERLANTLGPMRQAAVADGGLTARTLSRGVSEGVDNRALGEIDGAGNYPTSTPTEEVGRLNRVAPDTPEFKEFFGNSQAVDATGQPVVVYHLTKADNLEAFDKAKLGSNTGATSAKEGFFFAGDPNTVNVYAKTAAETGSTPNVIPVYLSLQNPLVADMGGSLYRTQSYASILRKAKQAGHDGVIIKNTFDGGSLDDIYVAFEPTQIKSALGNTGAYSKTDPRINYDVANGWSSVDTGVKEAPAPTDRFTKFDPALDTAAVQAAPVGVSLSPTVTGNRVYELLAADVANLAEQFLPPGYKIILSKPQAVKLPDGTMGTPAGAHMQYGPDTSVIFVGTGSLARGTMVHEVGHAIKNIWFEKASPSVRAGVVDVYADWLTKYTSGNAELALAARGPIYRVGTDFEANVTTGKTLRDTRAIERNEQYADEYYNNFNEFMAEQFNKHVEAHAAGLGPNPELVLSKGVIAFAKEQMLRLVDLFKKALNLGWIKPDTRMDDFFLEVFTKTKEAKASKAENVAAINADLPDADFDTPAQVANSIMVDPDANRFGLGTVPVGTKAERDDAKAILALHRTAEQDAPVMTPKYLENVKNLADNSVFNVASTGLTMLKSQSPLVRWVASQLLEDASGVQAKRGTTAAIKKHLMERFMMDNTINDINSAYSIWKNGKAGGWQDDLIGGKNRAEFDRLMAEEIEARRVAKAPVSTDGNVKSAVDSIEAAYTRTAKAQIDAKTLGSEGLPTSSVGYMPHRMSAKAVFNLTNEKREVVHQALTDQFINIEGWDASFSDMLASKYMQRVLDRATGGNSSTLGGNSSSSVALVEEALNNMQLPADQVAKHMASFKKGAANFTKGRIELDLNKVYPTAQGDFKLLDIFETNQIELLRSQVQRASGDVALALKGVQGKPGLTLLRKAMQFGEDGKKASPADLEAFDQIAAELMGEPFGTATPRWMERAMSANTLVRLGGIVYNQISESINGIVHLGVMRVLESVIGIPRLRQEILALARGEKVNNSIIGSIELAGGAEFGTDAYKIVMPFDNPSNTMPTYGQDTLTLTDRLLRGGGHIQAKLSGWRAIHSAQQRGMAEQIVHKTLRYIREGKDDIALQQFGITPELQQAMRAELGTIARFDGDRLVEFDVTKMTDPAMREQLIQAVWRGTSQIIQGTYIGERGKWAHDGTLKLLTQFRTFSITSMEKQWGRQRNSRGAFATFGIIMGAMSLAAPIYMARTYASSIGRPDQAEYLEERFQPQHLARATMNYVANLGLAPDMIDGLSAMLPESLGVKPTGGRAGVETGFIGNYVAPASSLVDDVWKYAQSPLEMDDAARILPLRNLPYLVPLMNLTKE